MTVRKVKQKSSLGFSEGLSAVAVIFILALLLKNSVLAATEVSRALNVCAAMLIPSLFPLMVASEAVTETGAIERLTEKLQAPLSKILGVSKAAAVPYFLGLVGGYTTSCKSAVLLLESGKISKSDCESVIALSSMPSLAFLTGFIGNSLFKSSTVGWILWSVTVISSLVLGIFNRIFLKNKSQTASPTFKTKHKSFAKIMVDSVTHSAYAMLIICACVVFFSVLIGVLRTVLCETALLDTDTVDIILGSLEITRGVEICANIENSATRIVLCAGYVGWSGLCVHFQTLSLCSGAGLSFKRYFILKTVQGLVCSLLTLILFLCFPELLTYK